MKKEMRKRRASASTSSEVINQLCDLVVPKLAEKIVEHLLPKQRVVSSNLITRSSLENREFLRGNPFLFGPGK